MESIKDRLEKLRSQVPPGVKIIAVSKTKPISAVLEAYEAGQRIFAENKVQEILAKQPELPKDIEWHMIGHLQTNKVKQIIPLVHLIHSVDSEKLLQKIQQEASKQQLIVSCLIQVHIATEETKFGFDEADVRELFERINLADFPNIRFCGLMGMASFVTDQEQIRQEFQGLKKLFDELKTGTFNNDPDFAELSMGMTGDFQLAIDEGSTMIRIGTLLFGIR